MENSKWQNFFYSARGEDELLGKTGCINRFSMETTHTHTHTHFSFIIYFADGINFLQFAHLDFSTMKHDNCTVSVITLIN